MLLYEMLLNVYLQYANVTQHNDKYIKHGMHYAAYQHSANAFEYDDIHHYGTKYNASVTTSA
jgi:hypothetical protein